MKILCLYVLGVKWLEFREEKNYSPIQVVVYFPLFKGSFDQLLEQNQRS